MRIGVFCSGGDAPGMNACVRAVVRTGVAQGHEVVGIMNGYQGLLDQEFFEDRFAKVASAPVSTSQAPSTPPAMTARSVSDWSRHGGAFLGSSRSEEFRTPEGVAKAADILRAHGIDALIPIGGDGTFRGAVALGSQWEGRIVGCPGTIDNDLKQTDYTIGFSTAVSTAVDALDKIRDTAESHERMFLIEVMGRHSGYIAVHTALAGAAEVLCIPETDTNIPEIVELLHNLRSRKKRSVMMIVAEGDERGDAAAISEQLKAAGCAYSTRVVVLGHLQRGGSPTPEDRLLATQLGAWAVAAVEEGHTGVMCGRDCGARLLSPFEETFDGHRPIPQPLLQLIDVLAK
ncbi:MAG: 6-phosphofructokinase [Planctomycetales bacterium]|nr:6-phosphofructokinase [Planctomycetales bacterium]